MLIASNGSLLCRLPAPMIIAAPLPCAHRLHSGGLQILIALPAGIRLLVIPSTAALQFRSLVSHTATTTTPPVCSLLQNFI